MQCNCGRAGLALALLALGPAARPDVHRDCFAGQYSLSCRKDRIDDARAVDGMLAPVAARAGWARECVEVEYVKGDNDGPDAILVILSGSRGASASACRSPPYEPNQRKAATRAAGTAVLKKIGADLKAAILSSDPRVRTRVLANVDVIELGDGWGGAATISLRGEKRR